MPQNITIHPPIGGTVRRTSFQNQAPYTSYDSFNYWPIDVKTGRLIPAIRPPHVMLDAVTGPVNLLQRVNGYASGKPIQSFVMAEDTDLYWWDGDSFVAATGASASDIDANRPLFAATYLTSVFIPQETGQIQVFDYTTGAVAEIVESAGVAPVDVDFMAFHLGAVWAIKDNQISVSRVGDALDWDFSAPSDDLYGAFFFDGEFSGLLGGLVTAFAPVSNDFAIVSTVEGLLALRGHPRQGGVIEPLIQNAYIMGQGAWCQAPNGTVYFMTPLGLMSMAPSMNAIPAQVSREKIPDELVGLEYDRDDPVIQMIYEPRWDSILIYIRGMETQAWLYDLGTGGFNRMDCPADVLALMNFPPFSTSQNSTTLHGRFDGISYYDKFGTESIPGSIIVGPVKIARTALDNGKVIELQVVFGRDTPVDATGRLRVAGGVDGQDAISRLSAGTHQYSIDLNVLKANYGKCHPMVSGHAIAIAIDTDEGDVSFEEMVISVEPAGRRRFARSPQMSVTGTATDFTPYDELDDEVWRGYSSATIQIQPGGSLPAFTHFLDLSLMPATWWAEVQEDGRDIRVSTTANVELPCKVLSIDTDAQTGCLAFKTDRTTAALSIRCWCGNPLAAMPTASAFDEFWGILIPDGYYQDVLGLTAITRRGDAITAGTTPTYVASPFGGNALSPQSLVGVGAGDDRGHYFQYGNTGTDLFGGTTFPASGATIVALVKGNSSAGFDNTGWELNPTDATINGSTSYRALQANSQASNQIRAQAEVNTASTVDSSANGTRSDWNHIAATFTDAAHTAFINGATNGSGTTVTNINVTRFGILFANGISGTRTDSQAMVQLHTTVRSATWLAYQAQMRDQAAFWGTFGVFTNVNPAIDPPTSLPIGACPTGVEPVVETGTWTGYCSATPVAPTAALLYHTHLIDLANMHASWWSAVSSSGSEIRATGPDDVPIPFCLIAFNKTANTGLAAVRCNQFVDEQNEVRLWVGNGSAITIPPCGLYGAYSAFDDDYLGFYADGRGNDSTGHLRHLTDDGTVTVVTGPIGNLAATYGLDGRSSAEVTATLAPEQVTISAAIQASTDLNDCTVGGIFKTGTPAKVKLGTAASSLPCRLYVSDGSGKTATTLNSVNPGVVNWFQATGVVSNQVTRRLWINGGGSQSTTSSSVQIPGFNRISIGASPNSGASANPITVSLFAVHSTVRPQSWTVYQTQMLDQDAFWQVATWPFTSGTLTL
jgi:hypothetical protein